MNHGDQWLPVDFFFTSGMTGCMSVGASWPAVFTSGVTDRDIPIWDDGVISLSNTGLFAFMTMSVGQKEPKGSLNGTCYSVCIFGIYIYTHLLHISVYYISCEKGAKKRNHRTGPWNWALAGSSCRGPNPALAHVHETSNRCSIFSHCKWLTGRKTELSKDRQIAKSQLASENQITSNLVSSSSDFFGLLERS